MAGRRQSYEIAGTGHQNPVPYGSKVGNVLVSGLIVGRDTAAGAVPDDLDRQAELMFTNAGTLVAAAGGTMDDIVNVMVYLKDPSDRSALNKAWLATFPDPHNRPARHVVPIPAATGGAIACIITAVIE